MKVPRSYYYNVSILPNRKEPTIEELQKLVERTAEQIRTGIAHVVPLAGAEAWEARVDVIPDEVPLSRPPIVGTAPDTRRVALDWGIAGAMGALAAAWYGRLVGHRFPPAGAATGISSSIRYHRGTRRRRGPPNEFASSSAAIPNPRSASSSAGPAREPTRHDDFRTDFGEARRRRPPAEVKAARPRRDSEESLAAISPLRKAAIVLVSLEQSLASQLLSHLDRRRSRR